MTATHLDHLTEEYLAHLVRWAPVQACLLGDARGLGRIEPILLEKDAVAAERHELDALARKAAHLADAPNDGTTALLWSVLAGRLVERRLRPRLYQGHRRPDLPLDLLAEAVQQALVWPGLRPARRRALLHELLSSVPRMLAATTRRLGRGPLPKPWVDLALLGVDDTSSLLVRDLGRWIAHGILADPEGKLALASQAAGTALERYGHYLSEVSTRDAGFRAGATALGRWLAEVERIPISPRRALLRGKRALVVASQELRAAALRLHPHADPTLTILSLEEDRVGDLLVAARKLVAQLRAFCEKANLVTLPDGPPCRVEKAPDYLAALTQACLDTPGPLQPAAAPTRYLLGLPPEHATPEESDLLHRLLNRTTLTWISAHETYPGHHVQHLHLCGNGSPVHPLLRVADSETFIEGWAHYSEMLLVEHGFQDGDPKLDLGISWAKVVRLCRLVAAIEIHAGRASVADAIRLFEENALMDAEDARREALRAVSDPTVLSYALGRQRIEALRIATKKRQRRAFSLRDFHDRLLGMGNAPIDLRTAGL